MATQLSAKPLAKFLRPSNSFHHQLQPPLLTQRYIPGKGMMSRIWEALNKSQAIS